MNEATGNLSESGPVQDVPGGMSGLAHDLKTWLTPIRTCLQLWDIGEREKAEALRPAALENLRVMMACLEQMRPQSNPHPTRLKAVEITGLLERAAALNLPLTQEKKLSVTLQAEGNLKLAVDEILLLRLLTNLLNNAVQAAPVGDTIKVQAAPAQAPFGWIQISISNSCAIGTDTSSMEGRTAPQRWGIGLRICREIATIHGGQMDIIAHEAPPAITVVITLPGLVSPE